MARVPRARDIGVSSFNVGNAPQIDIGVAKEIGRAGNAIGQAVASLGNAFGEVAGRVGAAQGAQAEADWVLDWNQRDFNAWTGLSKQETPDGSSWQGAGQLYQSEYDTHVNDPKYAAIPEKRKLELKRWTAGQIQQRLIGPQGAAVRYQQGQLSALTKDLETRSATAIGELSPDSPLVSGLPETDGESSYNQLYEDRRQALHKKVDLSVGTILSPKQAEQVKADIDKKLFETKLQWLQSNDPDAYEKALEEAEKLERDEIFKPEDPRGNEAFKDSTVPIFDSKVPSVSERKSIFQKGGVVVNLDTNWAKGNKQTSPMVVIPDNATPAQREAAEAYANGIAQVYKQKFGKSLNPRVVTRSQNGRGRPFTIHTEPYSVNDKKAVDFFNSPEGAQLHAEILNSTFGKVPGVHFSIPHNPAKGDSGAAGSGGNEVAFAKNVLGYIKGGGQQVAQSNLMGGEDAARTGGLDVNLTAYSPQKGGSKMEGGYAAARKGPDGQAVVRTLADVASGKSEYVTIAGDKSQFGKTYIIPEISFVDRNGKTQTLKNVKAVVHDTGSAFKGKPEGRFDVAIDRDASNKQMQASHAMWKKQGVRFVPEGEAGQQEQQVAAVQGGGEEIQVADAEGRIPQSAIQEFIQSNGAKINELADSEPDTPIAEVVSPEALEIIKSRVPEGVDVASITVSDARDLIEEAGAEEVAQVGAQEVAQASGLHDSIKATDAGASAPVERPLGPIKAGGEISVKSKYGTIKFRSEEWNNLDAKTISRLRKQFNERRKIATKQTQQTAREMMKDEEESWLVNGQSLGEKYYNPAVIDKAFPPGTKERAQHEAKVGMLRAVAKVFEDEGDVSLDEIDARIEEMKPEAGPEFAIRAEAWRQADKRRDKLIKMRSEDPAQASESSSIVKQIRSQFDRNTPNSRTEKQKLIEARMAAQRNMGIPKELRSPITEGEAESLAAGLEGLPDDEIMPRLEDLAKSIRENYGKDYSGVVMKAIVNHTIRRQGKREEIMGLTQELISTGQIGNMSIERARENYALRARNVMDWGRSVAERRKNRAGYTALSDRARLTVEEIARRQGMAPPLSGAPSREMGMGMPQPKVRRQPTTDEIRTLSQRELERQFGLSAVEAFALKNKNMRGHP